MDEKKVREVARLARLELSDEEVERFAADLESILEAFKELDNVDTDGLEPSFHPVKIEDVFREDTPEKPLSQEEALSNSPNTEDGFFKGPRIV
ncbi:MAG: Asp-tRNA(Asn)/Glu-tRNA(Gln) amidotransferase GatCAB subunit C [Candidatus Aenigmatarchaeota archaeon]|nr:MAG: Asp-tRNA(Asn)/Glu-tRNA(Gln) amidotransferase GatCAB subunit C [Candidatus Aenigmarchaeota archaeon]